MDHRKQFKKKTIGFGNLEDGKIIRAINCLERRRRKRSDLFNSIRQINEPSISPDVLNVNSRNNKQATESKVEEVPETREKRLAKWRAERELKKKLDTQSKRPAFHAGVYNHKFDSPIFLHQVLPPSKPAKLPAALPRITRATAKRLAMKNSGSTISVGAGVVESGKVNGGTSSRDVKTQGKKNTAARSFAPQNHKFKPPDSLPCLPLFGQEAVENGDDNGDGGLLKIYFSPYVVAARGKRASRIEQLENFQLETDLGIVGEKDKDNCQPVVLEIEEDNSAKEEKEEEDEEERTTVYFRNITEREITRLKARCFDWLMIKSDPDLSEDAQLLINQAIGQTQLLISKKIEQFKKLINDCENGSGDKPVTCQDLQGFWDMMYMQVEDCDARFEKLKKLQEKNWIEEQESVADKRKPRKATMKKSTTTAAAATKKNASKTSSIREMIIAARKKKMETANEDLSPPLLPEKEIPNSRLSSIKFDGGFFVVESPQKVLTTSKIDASGGRVGRISTLSRTPIPSTVSKDRLSALSTIKISQILKPLEIPDDENVDSEFKIGCMNRAQTPGRSILKKTDIPDCIASIKKVNFSENNKETNFQNISASTIGDRTGNEYPESANGDLQVKKKLDFLNISSSESEHELSTPDTLENREIDPRQRNCDDNPTVVETLKSEDIEENFNRVEKKLNAKRVTRQNSRNVIDKIGNSDTLSENKNIKFKEENLDNCSTEKDLEKENEVPEILENMKRRRSTRKSVKFTGEECSACNVTKIVHPMTPGPRRRTSKYKEIKKEEDEDKDEEIMSNDNAEEKRNSPRVDGDLISWETPKELPPQRVRRSLRTKKPQK